MFHDGAVRLHYQAVVMPVYVRRECDLVVLVFFYCDRCTPRPLIQNIYGPLGLKGAVYNSTVRRLLLWRAALVTVAVRIQIPRLMAGMIVMFARHLLLTGLVAMAMLVEIARLVSGMIVMRSGLFLWHCFLQMLRVIMQPRAMPEHQNCSLHAPSSHGFRATVTLGRSPLGCLWQASSACVLSSSNTAMAAFSSPATLCEQGIISVGIWIRMLYGRRQRP